MFTGLVSDLGEVLEADRSGEGLRLRIGAMDLEDVRPGDSVAVNGICLTAARVDGGSLTFEVMHETLGRSSLPGLTAGARVNLELPLRPTDRLGGHIVQGHVDGMGTVGAVTSDGFARRLDIQAPPDLLRYVIVKGSIAVDGVSLTVAAVQTRSFTVSVIPETLQRTNLGELEPGDSVNLEVDMVAKYVEKLVRP